MAHSRIKFAARRIVEHIQNYKNEYISGSYGTDLSVPMMTFSEKTRGFLESNPVIGGTAYSCYIPKIAGKITECATNVAYSPMMLAMNEPTMANFLATVGVLTYAGFSILRSK